MSRPGAAAYVERLEGENEFLRTRINVKDGQLAVSDKTIEAMLERDRESNILVSSFRRCSLHCYRNRRSSAQITPIVRNRSVDNDVQTAGS